jgi:hypothetical protein
VVSAGIPAARAAPLRVQAASHMADPYQTNNTFSDAVQADRCVYYLVCLGCRSRLEVTAGLAGQTCKCPTCGINFVVPELAHPRRLPAEPLPVGSPPEERVAPHAYAAAGEMAPRVVEDSFGHPMIRCTRCGTISEIDANACRNCGIPFTVEAGSVEPAFPVDGWAVASIVLGMISLATYVPVLAAGAVAAGLVALKSVKMHDSGPQRVSAWAGMVWAALATVQYLTKFISGF